MAVPAYLGSLSNVAYVGKVSTLIVPHSSATLRGTSGYMLGTTSSLWTHFFVLFSVSMVLVVSIISVLGGDGALSWAWQVFPSPSPLPPPPMVIPPSSSSFLGELAEEVTSSQGTRVFSWLLGAPSWRWDQCHDPIQKVHLGWGMPVASGQPPTLAWPPPCWWH